ncbi:MAG TPA: hypothetical protein VF523_11960, partial [Burkholderiales bacterium]
PVAHGDRLVARDGGTLEWLFAGCAADAITDFLLSRTRFAQTFHEIHPGLGAIHAAQPFLSR